MMAEKIFLQLFPFPFLQPELFKTTHPILILYFRFYTAKLRSKSKNRPLKKSPLNPPSQQPTSSPLYFLECFLKSSAVFHP